MSISEDTKRRLAKPISRIPSGVYILTTTHNNQSQAMLASWVQQAAFDPPCVSIALAKGRPIGDMIRASGRLCLSILADGDTTLMKKYARGIPPNEDPFAGVRTQQTPAGLPALSDALAYLDCRLLATHDFAADHELLIAEITAAEILKEGGPFVHVRGNGFHY